MSGASYLRQSHKIRDWLLLILRFAITQEEADRAVILATAQDMDRLGARNSRSGFAFFVKASAEICDLIAGENDPSKSARLRRQLSRIYDDRLRRALEAALEFKRSAPRTRKSRLRHGDLWRGLPIRQ